MKWWHALALLAVGFGVGRADVSLMGTAKWEVGSETEKELRALELRLGDLARDQRLGLTPAVGDEESRRMVALVRLRSEAFELEGQCQATFQRHPDTLSHQYALLTARSVTDRAINLTIWHQLAGLPVTVLPTTGPARTVQRYTDDAKLRIARRGFLTDAPRSEGGIEYLDTMLALADFIECAW